MAAPTLSTTQAAEVLGVHPRTLIDWVNAGKVRALKTPGKHYRFLHTDLEDFIAASVAEPKTGAAS